MTTTTSTIAQRKADILRLAQDAVAQRGQRRRARHHALLTLLLTAGVTVLAITLTPTRIAPSTPRPIAEAPPTPTPAPTPTPTTTIARVATTAGLAETLAAPTTTTTAITRTAPDPTRIARVQTTANPAQRLTDLEALALLREAGTPAGLIRIEGRVTLVYHNAPTPAGPASEAPTTLPSPLLAALPAAWPYRLP